MMPAGSGEYSALSGSSQSLSGGLTNADSALRLSSEAPFDEPMDANEDK